MKTFVITLSLLLLLTAEMFSQQWENIGNSITSSSIYDVHINGAGHGYAVGWSSEPVILKTRDFGTTWETLSAPSSALLFYVTMRGNDTVYIVGYSGPNNCGLVSISYDAGNNWEHKLFNGTDNPSSFGFYQYKITPKADYICGYGGAVFKSTDKGQSWSETTTGSTVATFRSIGFYNDKYGYAACDPAGGFSNINTLYSTTNGGESWEKNSSLKNSIIASIECISENTAFIFGYGGGTEAVQKTTDGGKTWEIVWSGESNKTLQGGKFFTSETGIAVGGNGTVIITKDGGNSWENISLPETNNLMSCSMASDMVYVSGAGGTLWRRTSLSDIPTVSNSQNEVSVYPVPAYEYCTVATDEQYLNGTIIMKNLSGEIVLQSAISGSHTQLTLNTITAGIYCLEIVAADRNNKKIQWFVHLPL